MGYNTTVFILNDHFHDIQENPEAFVMDILRGMHDGTDWAFGQTTVMRTAHADVPRLYLTHGNSIMELDEYATRTLEFYGKTDFIREAIRQDIKTAEDKLKRLKKKLNELDKTLEQ